MFLDPDPKRQKQTGSGFFQSQRPVEGPRDRKDAPWRRKNLQPLEERSASENNQQNPSTNPLKPTVRLVKPLSNESLADYEKEQYGDQEGSKENRHLSHVEQVPSSPTAVIDTSAIKQDSSGSSAYNQGFDVSDAYTRTNEAQNTSQFSYDNIHSPEPSFRIPRSSWQRRSGSSDQYSTASTLRGSVSGYGAKSFRTESRISDGTTLRGTPTPTELEHRERIEAEEGASYVSEHQLETLPETSPERSTVRLIDTPAESPSSGNTSSPERFSQLSGRPRTSPSSSNNHEAASPRQSSRRSSSTGSLPTTLNIRTVAASPTPRHQTSQESIAQSEVYAAGVSSPNLVAFSSDSLRPRSQTNPLHAATSIESIQSRLQQSTAARPATRYSEDTDNSWSSRPPTSDTLPPLQVPRKRLTHKSTSSSLRSAGSAAQRDEMEDSDFDTQPYLRHAFSMHLSTIASESDPQSCTGSQHLSHFSLGSGVLTVDDTSSARRSDTWPRQRTDMQHDDSDRSPVSPVSPLATTSDEEPGDMTMGLYRQESALPEPLFQARSPSAPLWTEKKYDGPLPPLPPIPTSRDNDEHFDVVPELSRPSLREQRSGYSLRRRSQSTPSYGHSRQQSQVSETSRWSQGTAIFPTWAKAYYAYGATLLSSSQISLSRPIEAERPRNQHTYNINRDWNNRSLSSSWGTSETASVSPASSRFLPSIFRRDPRREKFRTSKKWKLKREKSSPRPAPDRADSLSIREAPLPADQAATAPSDEPRYGNLKDSSEHYRPLPRSYSKQKKWDEMKFPRPMSSDLPTGYENDPRLPRSRRTGNPISTWRAPSFTESLHTLLHSRCNRQILFFALGFVCPLSWMVASVLPLPKKPMSASEFEKTQVFESEEDIQTTMMRHEAGDAERRWREERQWLKARWWRYLNRIMSVIGVLVIALIIALVVVATM